MSQEIPSNVSIIWHEVLSGINQCEIRSQKIRDKGPNRIEYLVTGDGLDPLNDQVFSNFLWATLQLATKYPDRKWTCWRQDYRKKDSENPNNAPYRIISGKFHKTIKYEDRDRGINMIYESDMGDSPSGFVTGPLPQVDLADLKEYKINYQKRSPKPKGLRTKQKSTVSISDPVSEKVKPLGVLTQPITIETSVEVAAPEQEKKEAEKQETKNNVTHKTVLDPNLISLFFASFLLNNKPNIRGSRRRQRLPGYPNNVVLRDRENDRTNYLKKNVPIWRSPQLINRTTYK